VAVLSLLGPRAIAHGPGGGHGGYHGGYYHGGHHGGFAPYGFGGFAPYYGRGFYAPYGYGFYRPYYGYGPGFGLLGVGIGLGGYGLGGYGLGSYGLGGYGTYLPYYGGGFGAASVPLMVNAAPATPPPADTSPPPDNAAHLQLLVPANAEVFFDGAITTQTGPTREFVSPPLEAGKVYDYRVRVRYFNSAGKPIDDARLIHVRANDWFRIDFTQPAPPQQPADQP
jgi:uncharacterized protein (TIGR03000 family)